jgi:hypothetical protein
VFCGKEGGREGLGMCAGPELLPGFAWKEAKHVMLLKAMPCRAQGVTHRHTP